MLRGRPGQPGLIQAVAGPLQHRVAAIGPQPVSGRLPQGRGAGPQTRSGPVKRLRHRPGLQQRVRRDAGRLINHGVGNRVAQRRLQHRAHPHRRRCRRPLDRQQPDALQRRQRGHRRLGRIGGIGGIGRTSVLAPAEVADGGRRGQHGCRNAVPVKQRSQGQHRPDRSAGGELGGALERHRPGDRARERRRARRRGQVLAPAQEVVLVGLARHRRAGDHRAGLSQRGRLHADDVDQVDRAQPVAPVGRQPLRQVAQRLARVERPDRQGPHAAGHSRGVGAGHQHPARWAGRAEAVQVGLVGQIVEDDQPWMAGLRQPAQELRGG